MSDLAIIGPGDGTVEIHEADCLAVAAARREKWPAIFLIPGRMRERLKREWCHECLTASLLDGAP